MVRFIISFVALFFISMFAFERFSGRLFTGLDGPAFLTKTEIQQSFFDKSLYLHNDLMEGLSSTVNDFNLANKSSVYPMRDIKSYAPLFYTWYAIQLFLATLIIGWNYQFPPRVYYLAAWLLTLTLLPYFQDFRIYSLSEAAPCFFEFIFIFALMDFGIQRMGAINWKQSSGSSAIFIAGLIYGLIFCPSAFVIITPALLVTTAYAFLKPAMPQERYYKLVMCVVLLILSLSLGWAQYAAGIILDSAASFFHTNITGFYHSRIYASILYIGNLSGSQLGTFLFCSATIGMLFALLLSKQHRLLALMILLCQLILAGGGAFIMSLPTPWAGPSLIYFEMVLFPFYALFAVYFIDLILNSLMHLSKIYNVKLAINILYTFFVIFFITCMLLQTPVTKRDNSYALPPKSTLLTNILEHEIAIQPNQLFAGRVANILPNKDWLAQCSYFLSLDHATGNDHQSSGLWYKHIPTLHNYQQEISPGFFSFYRRFLSTPQESAYRNWTSFSKVNTKILRLLGVKFVLTTDAHLANLKMRATLKTSDSHIEPLYLYELSNVNIAGISAKHVTEEASIAASENRLANNDFDLSTAVVINGTNLPNINLTPAVKSALRVIKNGFHLTADSNGKTLLILPLEFSHCIKVTPLSGHTPEIIRVDGILLGVLFDHHINSILQYQISPFDNAGCKLKNYLEFKRLWQGAA